MLGELISEATGRRTGRRVIDGPGGAPRVEVSFEDNGKLLGFDSNNIGTYWADVKPELDGAEAGRWAIAGLSTTQPLHPS